MSNDPQRSMVTFSISPCENGKVLFQKIAPANKGGAARGMLYFMVGAKNNTTKTIKAKGMVVSFPDSPVPSVNLPSRDVEIAPGASEEIGLAGSEAIQLPAQAPTKLRICVVFEGLTNPVIGDWSLGPQSTVFDFFSKPEDSRYGEFLMLPRKHVEGGSSQHFGYDVKAVGVNDDGQLSTAKTGGPLSADYFSWERPLYAMADGIVVRAVDDNEDNPAAGVRVFNRKSGTYQGTQQIDAVAVANLSPAADDTLDTCLQFAAVRTGGILRVLALRQSGDGASLDYLAGTAGSAADGSVAAAGISTTLAVTAHSYQGSTRLTLWGTTAAVSSLVSKATKTVSGLTDARLVKLTSTTVALLGKDSHGNLSLAIHGWQSGDASGSLEFIPGTLGSAGGGGVARLSFIRLTSTRVAAAVQTAGGYLTVIVWDIAASSGSAYTLSRADEAEGTGEITEVAIGSRNKNEIVTAVRTGDGRVKAIAWAVSDEGELDRRGDVMEASGTHVDVSYFKSEAYAISYRNNSGKLQIVAYELDNDTDPGQIHFQKLYQQTTDGPTDLFAVARIPTAQPTMATAVRTETGVLKVILWQFTDSNLIYILHGKEMAIFAHLRQGSIPNSLMTPGTAVKKGDLIGRMGHSGKSGAPHTHIHLIRIHDHLLADLPQLIADVAIGTDDIGEFRPLQFRNVLAVRLSGAVPGPDNNPMMPLNGQGTYFDDYIVWPAATAAQEPSAASREAVV